MIRLEQLTSLNLLNSQVLAKNVTGQVPPENASVMQQILVNQNCIMLMMLDKLYGMDLSAINMKIASMKCENGRWCY